MGLAQSKEDNKINVNNKNTHSLVDVVEPIQVLLKLQETYPKIPQKVAMVFANFADFDNNGIITSGELDALLNALSSVKRPEDMVLILF